MFRDTIWSAYVSSENHFLCLRIVSFSVSKTCESPKCCQMTEIGLLRFAMCLGKRVTVLLYVSSLPAVWVSISPRTHSIKRIACCYLVTFGSVSFVFVVCCHTCSGHWFVCRPPISHSPLLVICIVCLLSYLFWSLVCL